MKRREGINLLADSNITAEIVSKLPKNRFSEGIAGGKDKFLIVIGADGGWDTTCFFDPKGTSNGVNSVDVDNTLVTKSGIQWSAVSNDASIFENTRKRYAEQFRRFFTTYDNDLTIVKGLNTMTESHAVGSRIKFSGMYGNFPSLPALYGAVYGQKKPLSFWSFGSRWKGADYTGNLELNKALFGEGCLIDEFANREQQIKNDMFAQTKHPSLTRLQRQISIEKYEKGVSRRARKLEEVLQQNEVDDLLFELLTNINLLENEPQDDMSWYRNMGYTSGLKQQAKITAAAIATGLTSTANLKLGSFDSHENNDYVQFFLLTELIECIHYLVNALEFFDIADKTTIVVASDIGRASYYNINKGKDHSTNGGMMILHPKGSNRGGRVFGETDHLGEPKKIDLITGLPDEHGQHLNIQHMMLGLRNHLGLQTKAKEHNFAFSSNIILPGVFF